MALFDIPDDLIEHVSFSGTVVQRMIQTTTAAALVEASATIERQKSAMLAMEAVNQQQSDKLREAALTIAEQTKRIAELEAAPVPPVVVPDPVPPVVVVPGEIVGELPGFATYLVDSAGNGAKRTATMKGHIDKLKTAGIREVVMLCNHIEIEEGDLPLYLASLDMDWWADTFYAVYKVQTERTTKDIRDNVPADKRRDYFAETVKQCDRYKAHRGYVLDDVHSMSPAEFEAVVAAIRQHSSKPIVASFGVLSDISPYLPTINKHKVFVARQLYRQEKGDEPEKPTEDTSQERTAIVTTWLKKPGMICHIGNLEYFDAGGDVTRGDDLRYMYNRCIDAGLKSFMGYATVDTNGFRIWEHDDLWQALKDCSAAYPAKVKII